MSDSEWAEIDAVNMRGNVTVERMEAIDGTHFMFPPQRNSECVEIEFMVKPGDGVRILEAAHYGRLKIMVGSPDTTEEAAG